MVIISLEKLDIDKTHFSKTHIIKFLRTKFLMEELATFKEFLVEVLFSSFRWIQFYKRISKVKSKQRNHTEATKQHNNTLHLIKCKEMQQEKTKSKRGIDFTEE